MAKKFTVRKFNGDDRNSHAVFYSADVKGRGNIIFWGDAKPIVSGLTRRGAMYYRNRFEEEH